MRVNIAVDEKALAEVEKRLGNLKHKAPTVLVRALNRAATNAKKNIKIETTKRYRVKSSKLEEVIDVTKATRSSLGARVKASGSVIGLDHFKVSPATPAHPKLPKLKVGVKKGSLKRIPGAFVAKPPNTDANFVWMRTGEKVIPEKGRYKGKTYKRSGLPVVREKLKRLHGPAIPEMIGNEEIVHRVQAEAESMYRRTLDHEIDRLLGGSK